MPKAHPKLLLVEGSTDLCAIAEMIEGNGVPWPNDAKPVDIQVLNTKTPKAGVVPSKLKEPAHEVIGIILDADDDPDGTWTTIRGWLATQIDNTPEAIPEGGFISEIDSKGRRFGAWILPDNHSNGTLETLLKQLVRQESKGILDHAIHACDGAKSLNAPFRDVHSEKAHVFTWLAWQDEPGRNLRSIDFQSVFDPQSDQAQPFVQWFRNLFDV